MDPISTVTTSRGNVPNVALLDRTRSTGRLRLDQIPYRIETTRATLRAWSPDDAAMFFATVDAAREDLRRWLEWVDSIRSEADAAAMLRSARGRFDLMMDFAWACIARDGTLAGGLMCHLLDPSTARVSLTYWLAPKARGEGLGREAVRGLTSALLEQGGVERVEVFVDVNNRESRSLAEAVGFRREGVLQKALSRRGQPYDVVLFAIVGELPPPRERTTTTARLETKRRVDAPAGDGPPSVGAPAGERQGPPRDAAH